MSDYRELIKEAEAELEFATNGPWTLDELDAHFVLTARELVPALIAALRSVLDEQDAVKVDAWDEGFAAADMNTPRSRKGHWDDTTRAGFRTWIPDPIPTNPYRRALKGGETE